MTNFGLYTRPKGLKFAGAILLEFVAPSKCLVCGDRVGIADRASEFMCDVCFDNIPYLADQKELANRTRENFPDGELAISNFFAMIALKEDSDYMNLIHGFKYYGISRAALELGRALGEVMKDFASTDYDAVTPVPIHKVRRRERGYNQAEFIARGVAERIGVELDIKLLKRKKYAASQTKLTAEERKKNVGGVFASGRSDAANKKILIVDDVITTGSTINTCAEILRESGAARVDAAAVGAA